MEINTLPPGLGNLTSDANMPFRYAFSTFSPKHATSPVESISTPKETSAPFSLENENTGTLTPTQLVFMVSGILIVKLLSKIWVAIWIRLKFIVLETKGKVLDTLKLHSMTFSLLSLAIN